MASEQDWRKRARDLISGMGPKKVNMADFFDELEEAVIKLGNEMADERAEEIAKAIEAKRMARPHQAYFSGYEGQHNADMDRCAKIARSFISKKPESKAREQVLEEALRKARNDIEAGSWPDASAMTVALEWRGDA